MVIFRTFTFLVVALLASCTTTKDMPSTSSGADEGMHVILDTMTISPETHGEDLATKEPVYREAAERTWDLLHTILDLSFDWKQQAVIGKATLTLSPLFYTQDKVMLDAVDFNLGQILINGKESTTYTYDSSVLTIPLAQPMTRREKLTVQIDYVAKPRPKFNNEGAAITSDQGLFFIDPMDTIPELPMQIWTQGETSYNRKWYPTIDQPNERGTQEIFLTVADTFMTLSNGALVSSTALPNGMRRDHWKLDLPHAPYLAMVAVGVWDKVSDSWRGRPVDYYVDPGYGKDARHIFAHTPEMITFFSELLGYDFVWPTYAQVIVKDFVSGAMENTTAVVYGDFIQFHNEDMLEEGSNDDIVAHELFHHWFGNLVTTESWANLTLNEGFANYAEYLWSEYKYGRDKADLSRIQELSGYFDQAGYDAHPLIDFHYTHEGDMFDAHSYNKGGLVLHMLRDIVGDEAFFASLRLYLQRHAYSYVEVADLRLAFEETTGRDLNWFFNQWYFGTGHPVIQLTHRYDTNAKQLIVDMTQVQDQQGYYEVFRLPLEIGTYHADGSGIIHSLILDKKSKSFTIDLPRQPDAVVFDPRDVLLAVIEQDVPSSEFEIRLMYVPSIMHKISAFRVMDDISTTAIERMATDSSTIIRGLAIQYLAEKGNAGRIFALAQNETDLDLRFFILQSLVSLDPEKAKQLAITLLSSTNKNPVIYVSLLAIANVDIDEAILQATKFENNTSPAVYAARAGLFARKGSGASYNFFTNEKARTLSIDYLEEFITSFALFLSKQDVATQQKGLNLIRSGFFQDGPVPQYRRFYTITGLISQFAVEQNDTYKGNLKQLIKELFEQEEDAYLRQVLDESFRPILD